MGPITFTGLIISFVLTIFFSWCKKDVNNMANYGEFYLLINYIPRKSHALGKYTFTCPVLEPKNKLFSS